MLLCVFLSLTNQVCNYFVFLCKTYFVFANLKGECLKILILGKLGLKLVFWNNISSHAHAFYSFYSMLWGVFQKLGYFFKNYVFLGFRLIQSIFRSIEITFKILCELLSVSINRKSWISFSKSQIWLIQITFSKLFQTPFSLFDSDKHHPQFFVVFDQIFCRVFLSQGRYVHYTLSFSFIFNFTCIEGIFSNYA